jgi:hypothetical protein
VRPPQGRRPPCASLPPLRRPRLLPLSLCSTPRPHTVCPSAPRPPTDDDRWAELLALSGAQVELNVLQTGDVVPSNVTPAPAAPGAEAPGAPDAGARAPIGWANGNGSGNGKAAAAAAAAAANGNRNGAAAAAADGNGNGAAAAVAAANGNGTAAAAANSNGNGAAAAANGNGNGAAANGNGNGKAAANGARAGGGFSLFSFPSLNGAANGNGNGAAANGNGSGKKALPANPFASLLPQGLIAGAGGAPKAPIGLPSGLPSLAAAVRGAAGGGRPPKWVLQEAEFAPGLVGCKARNLVALRRRLPDWVLVPRRCAGCPRGARGAGRGLRRRARPRGACFV